MHKQLLFSLSVTVAALVVIVNAAPVFAYETNFTAGNTAKYGNAYTEMEEYSASEEMGDTTAAKKGDAGIFEGAGTDIKGQSGDFAAYLNDAEFEGADKGLNLAELDQDTKVVLGGDDNPGVALKMDYENTPFVE